MATRNLRVLRQHWPVHHQLLCALLPVRQERRGHRRVVLHLRPGLHHPHRQHHRRPEDPGQDPGAAGHRRVHLQRSADDLLLHAVCSSAGSTRGSDAGSTVHVQGIDQSDPAPLGFTQCLHTPCLHTTCLQHVYNMFTTNYIITNIYFNKYLILGSLASGLLTSDHYIIYIYIFG